jgi:UDP-glucose 4-epimerase
VRLLVTGVAGFLGSNLLDRLLIEGHEVLGIDDLSMGRLANIERHLEDPAFTFVDADITTVAPTGLDGFDRVVHLAARKIPRYGGAVRTLETNHRGTLVALEIASANQCKFVLASTSDVYGRSTAIPFREESSDPVIGSTKSARWSYAVSKLSNELMAFGYQDELGLPVTILRYFGSYGPGQHLSWWGGPQAVFINAALRGEPMTIHGDGRQTRTFTYVEDSIEGTYRAIVDDQANGDIFNIGSTFETNILDLAHLVHELCETGREIEIEFVPYESFTGRPYQDVMRRVPDTSHTAATLGFTAETTLEEGLKKTIAWQRNETT